MGISFVLFFNPTSVIYPLENISWG